MRTPLKRRQGVDGLQAFNRQTLPALGGLGGDADEQSLTFSALAAGMC
jgi:hypothetical protein